MKSLEAQLADAGLQVTGHCERLTSYGDNMLQESALLQDMTHAEADILGESMLLVRAEPGQVLIREGDTGEWMMLLLKGTVDITKRLEVRGAAAAEAKAALTAALADSDGGQTPAADGGNPAEQTSQTEQNQQTNQAEQNDEAQPPVTDTTPFSRIAVIRRGAAIGEMSMLDSEPRYASCTAIDAVEVGVLGRREIGLLIRDHPAVGAKLLVIITQLMAQRLRNISNQLVKLMLQKAT